MPKIASKSEIQSKLDVLLAERAALNHRKLMLTYEIKLMREQLKRALDTIPDDECPDVECLEDDPGFLHT